MENKGTGMSYFNMNSLEEISKDLESSISNKRKLIQKYQNIIDSIKASQDFKDKYLESKSKKDHHKFLDRTSIFTKLFRLFQNKEFDTSSGGHLTHNVNLEFEETELMDDILLVMDKHIKKENKALGNLIHKESIPVIDLDSLPKTLIYGSSGKGLSKIDDYYKNKSNNIKINIHSKETILNESDILDLIQIIEAYFDNSNPENDFYFSALAKMISKIHDKDSSFWTEHRLNKYQKKRND